MTVTGPIDQAAVTLRGAAQAAGDLLYMLGADGIDYNQDLTHLFGHVPVPVVCEVTQTVVGQVLIGHTASDDAGEFDALLQVHALSDDAAAVGVVRWGADTNPARFTLGKSRGAAIGTNGIVVTGDDIGSLDWAGDDGVDLLPNGTVSARILVESSGTIGADRVPTEMSFWTATDAAPSVLTRAMTIDAAGNVGIGVTPEATHASFTEFQWGAIGALLTGTAAIVGQQVSMMANTYLDTPGTWRRILDASEEASRYYQTNGTHVWEVAGAGVADSVITWTTAMTINSAGNVGVGVTPEAWSAQWTVIQNGGMGSLYAATTPALSGHMGMGCNVYYDGSNWRRIFQDEASSYTQVNGTHGFSVAGSGVADSIISFTPAMTINSAGNVGFGVTPSASWHANWTAMQLGGEASVVSLTSPGATAQTFYSHNVYFDGANWKRINANDEPIQYRFSDGTHLFRTAGTGAADSNVSWTDCMTIANDGLCSFDKGVFIKSVTAAELVIGASTTAPQSGLMRVYELSTVLADDMSWSGTQYIARDTEASFINLGGGTITFITDTALTAGNAFSPTTRMTIASDGDVGIGVVPESRLSLLGSDAISVRWQNTHAVTTDAAISLYDSADGVHLVIGSNFYIDSGSAVQRFNTSEESSGILFGYGGTIGLYTGGTGATASANMTIDSAGNVGIGVTPSYLLHLNTAAAPSTSQVFVEGDSQGGISLLSYQADNCAVSFDAVWSSSMFKSLDAGSNFNIYKVGDALKFQYDTGVAVDGIITWNDAMTIANDGDVTGGTAGSWALQNVAASATVPTLCPNGTTTAGIGMSNTYQGHLISLATNCMTWQGATTATAANSWLLNIPGVTKTVSGGGTQAYLDITRFDQPVIEASVATTITDAATVRIVNAPDQTDGDVTITNPWALWVDAGNVRLDGIIRYAGTMGNSALNPATDAPADWVEIEIGGTTYYVPAYAAS